MQKRIVLAVCFFVFSLVACNSTSSVPPVQNGPITFINVRSSSTVKSVMPNSPGATVNPSIKVKSLRLELFRPDGTAWWHNDETGSMACITGIKGGVCNSWTTNYAPDGTYKLKAVAKLEDGSSVNGEVSFLVGNQVALPPSNTPPPPPGPPVARPAWNDVRSWMREDANCKYNDLLNSKFNMITVSARCTGRFLETSDLQQLKASGKWVLAYEDVSVAAP